MKVPQYQFSWKPARCQPSCSTGWKEANGWCWQLLAYTPTNQYL